MQKLLGYSPLEAGAGAAAVDGHLRGRLVRAGPLYERLGAKPILTAGATCLFAGMLLLSFVGGATRATWPWCPGWSCSASAPACSSRPSRPPRSPCSTPRARASPAAILYMFQVAGGSIGLGLTTTVFASASQRAARGQHPRAGRKRERRRGPRRAGRARGHRAGGARARALPGQGAADHRPGRRRLRAGMQWGFRVDAALAAVGVLVTVLWVGGPLRKPAREPRAAEQRSIA